MKQLLLIFSVVITVLLIKHMVSETTLTPQEADKRIAAGTAVLIDVREPSEWAEGIAKPAILLSLSDLTGARTKWKPFLELNREKELLVYCRSGNRSGKAAGILSREGFKVSNAGSFDAWKNAGLPTRKP